MSEDLVASDWDHINIRLVGAHPLWGHYLFVACVLIFFYSFRDNRACYGLQCRWNAARSFATYLDTNPQLYRDRFVLELGAGGGLPGIVAAKNGARKVALIHSLNYAHT